MRAPKLPYPPITTTRMAYPSRAWRIEAEGAPDLISRVHAAVAAGFAPHFHAASAASPGFEVLPDPHGDILQARDLQAVDLVSDICGRAAGAAPCSAPRLRQVGDESGFRIDLSQQNDARDEECPCSPW